MSVANADFNDFKTHIVEKQFEQQFSCLPARFRENLKSKIDQLSIAG